MRKVGPRNNFFIEESQEKLRAGLRKVVEDRSSWRRAHG